MLHPATARSLWSIGLVLLKLGNYEDATLRFDQALKVGRPLDSATETRNPRARG